MGLLKSHYYVINLKDSKQLRIRMAINFNIT